MSVEQIGGVYGCGASDRQYTHTAENQVVRDMLAIEGLTHFFMTENDMILPDDAVLRLLEMQKPVASGLYFLRNGWGQPCLYKRLTRMPGNPYSQNPIRVFPTEAPFRLDGCCGLGCVLIERQVFETLKEPWFDLGEGKYGSDMYFYRHVRDAGFEVWVDPQVRCDQIEYAVWGYHDYRERLDHDPAFAASGGIIGGSQYP